MGDVAMTAPIVEAACRANPDVKFDFLSVPFHQPFFPSLPNLNFIGTNIRKEKNGLSALWKLFRQLKKNDYDLVLDLHNVLRTKVIRNLFSLSGVPSFKINKGRREKKLLTSGKSHEQLRPMTQRYADVFRAAGLSLPNSRIVRPAEPLPPQCSVSKADGELWIGVSPFAQHKGKMYPADRMRKVLKLLSANPNVRIFVFGGGESEKNQANLLIEGLDNCHNVIGLMKLADEMALMSNLDVMLSMDSSAMHLCSLYGVRVVSIWGATHPFAGFLGYHQDSADVVQRDDLDCRPCSVFGNKPCRFNDYRCFDIDPSVVVNRILASL